MTTSSSDDPAALYDALKPDFENLEQEALHCLRESSVLRGIKIHSISGRVKERSSFLEKIERKKYKHPIEETDDLVGIRIVCLFTDDLKTIGEAVAQEFGVLHAEDKVHDADVASFGYMSQHYVCRLRPEFHGRRYDRIKNQKFEVQCRTLLMDAWANVSHHLAYKGEKSIPTPLRKDFHALSGLLYVADRQFQSLLSAAKESQAEAANRIGEVMADGADEPLDLSTMQALLDELFPDRAQINLNFVSEFVEELAVLDIVTVSQLRKILRKNLEPVLAHEKQIAPGASNWFTQVGAVRRAVLLEDGRYDRILTQKAMRRRPE